MAIQVGDWITSYTPGIWRVYRVLPIEREMRFSPLDRRKKSKRVIVFSTRIVDGRWKRAFKTESCEQSLAHPLSDADKCKLAEALNIEPDLLKAFEQYIPEPVDLIVNLSMSVPKVESLKEFCSNTLNPVIASGKSMQGRIIWPP